MTPETPACPLSPQGMEDVATILRNSIVPSTRVDGWSAAKQRRFLESIADGDTVRDACDLVRLSPASAYAFRRRPKGRAFDLGWKAADLLARERVAADLLIRATEGQTVQITRDDGSTVTRHHYDNRLAVQMLNRLDRYADASEASAPGHAARMIAGDFDAYLDLVGDDGGPARAGLFMLAHGTDGHAQAAELEPVLALARADRHLRCGTRAPDLDVSDLDPARRADWTAAQWARAETAGLLVLAPPPAPETEPASTRQPVSTSCCLEPEERPDPVWWDEIEDGWRTRFPPPWDFLGAEGEFGEPGYHRELDESERDAICPASEAAVAERVAVESVERDRWFADRLAEANAPPSAAPSAPVPVPVSAPVPAPSPATPPAAADDRPAATPRHATACTAAEMPEHASVPPVEMAATSLKE